MENATQTHYANRLIASAFELARHVEDADLSDTLIVSGEECRACLELGKLLPGNLEEYDAWLSGVAEGNVVLDRITSTGRSTVDAMTAAAKAIDSRDFHAHAQAAGDGVAAFERVAACVIGLSAKKSVVTAWSAKIDYAYISNAEMYTRWVPDPKDFAAVRADFDARSALVRCRMTAMGITWACWSAIDAEKVRARLSLTA